MCKTFLGYNWVVGKKHYKLVISPFSRVFRKVTLLPEGRKRVAQWQNKCNISFGIALPCFANVGKEKKRRVFHSDWIFLLLVIAKGFQWHNNCLGNKG